LSAARPIPLPSSPSLPPERRAVAGGLSAARARRERARFRKVLDHIETHLHEDLTLERLAAVAAWSKFHFQRQFALRVGVGVARYIQLKRLHRAAFQLAFRQRAAVGEIAAASGYGGPEAFARAFRQRVGQTPSEFRAQPLWALWHAAYQPLRAVMAIHMTQPCSADQVRIVDFVPTRVAVLEHRGAPHLLGDSIRRFIEWRKQNHLPPRLSATYNIVYDDPLDTRPEDYRLDLCAAVPGEVAANAQGVVGKTLPGGRCAVLRHVGTDQGLAAAAAFLYTQWLPASGESLRDVPLVFQRIRFFPDVAEHEAVTDVFLPLR
jgi:AraC family transcriptional regulator